MTSRLPDPDAHTQYLPQCGLGPDYDFDSLASFSQFLFRVYTPKERSPFADDTDPFFVAPRFDELVARSPVDLPQVKFPEAAVGTFADVVQHMEWTTRTSSAYVSTSLSFTWAIWEAVRRYHIGMKKDVEIAIIDASALNGRAATAIQLLEKSRPEERNEQFWKWHRFSKDSQSVLVYGVVPRTAVLASVPLLKLLRKLPSYFLRQDVQIVVGNPLDQVAWDYAKRRHNFRQFCQALTQNFLGKPSETRLRDSTAGAVRLALAFLRPVLHRTVQDDFDVAVSYLRKLSSAISMWPNREWFMKHPEVQKIIDVMVLAVLEELRDGPMEKSSEEITRLQQELGQMQQTIRTQQETNVFFEHLELGSDDEFGVDESDEPTLVDLLGSSSSYLPSRQSPAPSHAPVDLSPKISIAFQTPITPPDSPRNSIFSPRVSVPSAILISAGLQPAGEEVIPAHDAEYNYSLSPPPSDEAVSQLPTFPVSAAIYSHAKLPTIVEADIVQEEGGEQDDAMLDEVKQQSDSHATGNCDGHLGEEEAGQPHISGLTQGVPGLPPDVQVDKGDINEPTAEEQNTNVFSRHELIGSVTEDERYSHPFPGYPWVAIRQLNSPLSSRRSSLMSVDTLCEPVEFPSKRMSFSAPSDVFEFVPTMRSQALSSRTVSFSEFSPPGSPICPTQTDPVAVTRPQSPGRVVLSLALQASNSASTSRSRASSSSSSTDSSMAGDRILPLITPLPPSPAWSVYSLPSSISRSSSSSSSSPPVSPVKSASEKSASPTSPSPSLDVIIPPKQPISLLLPLSNGEHMEHYYAARRRRTRPVVGETASYIVTGFLFGAFITIFLLSTQRKTMLYVT